MIKQWSWEDFLELGPDCHIEIHYDVGDFWASVVWCDEEGRDVSVRIDRIEAEEFGFDYLMQELYERALAKAAKGDSDV